jgi:hypothetical protein
VVLILIAGLVCSTVAAEPDDRARKIANEAKAAADSIKGQAAALVSLAWLEKPHDPEVAAFARAELVAFGAHGLGAMKDVLPRVDPVFAGDVTATLISARRTSMANLPPDYIPALEEAVWTGSPEAQRLAIPELAMHRYGPAVLACIDAALENPANMELVVRSLGTFRSDRARFFLEEVLLDGPDDLRAPAAQSLAAIGGQALTPLRNATRHANPAIRRPAILALIPDSGIDDLTVLYEYMGSFSDDDPRILEAIRDRARLLEALLEQQLDEESASPGPGG